MPSIFGKSHLYRYDIQGSGKRHYLVFVHLPCLFTHFKHFHPHLSSYPHQKTEQSIIECLMDDQSLTRDCLEFVFQRLQIRDRKLFHCFALSYFNKNNQQSFWLDPNLPMRSQLPKNESKPNLTFTFLLYPQSPENLTDEKAKAILYEQLFCNFVSSVYTFSMNSSVSLWALFLRACFPGEIQFENNRELLRTILQTISQPDELQPKIVEFYRNLKNLDSKSAQNQLVNQLAELSTYGMIHLECKNSLNEKICLGLNYQGLHSRSLVHQHFKLETSWPSVDSIRSSKNRQINIVIKPTTAHSRTLSYFTDSTSSNRYSIRILEKFFENFRSASILPKKSRILSKFNPALSVPDLRSDGETSSFDRTPSSTRSSVKSEKIWSGSLPNLTVQLGEESKQKVQSKNDPYGTYSENLDKTLDGKSTRRSSDVSQKSRSSTSNQLSDVSSLIFRPSLGLSSSQIKLIQSKFSKISFSQLSPCFSCECLVEPQKKESSRNSSSNSSTLTSQNRSLLNSRNFLSSSSVPLEAETISVGDEATTDNWLAEFESKISSNEIYDEFESISVSRLNSSADDGRLAENVRRNRFIDVVPYDDTRVRLIPHKENLHGYINASHVKIRVENTIYSYIAAESPLPLTVDDFWRMISGSNVHVVVMLLPSDFQLCANYFPRSKNEIFRTELFNVELVSEQIRQDFHIRHLKIKFINGQRTRTLVHLQYLSWDDQQTPKETSKFIEFVNVANTFRRHYGETNPLLVHCTAGIGRTGIFILIHVMIQCITFNKKVSVASVLKVMREHRMSMVDRTYSYIFVYRCLIDYLKSSRLI